MPGLLRGVARTAVVAGTASAVSGRVQRRQAEKYAVRDANIVASRQDAYNQQVYGSPPPQQYAPQPQYAEPQYAAPAPAPAPGPGAISPEQMELLRQLGDLKQQGVLTAEEFAVEKAKILNS
jgi:hypothetical protein